MNGWNKNEMGRLCAFLLCAILLLMSIDGSAINESYLRSGGDVPSQPTIAESTPTKALPALTLGPSIAPQDTEPPVEDSELSQSQVNALLQNAALLEGETAEDYFCLPEGMQREEGALSILLIGVDNRDLEKAGRSDTMILAKLNLKTGAVRMISFLRDMYVKIPGKGMNRLNAAYYYGGAPLLLQTLETNFGVHIDGTVALDFSMMTSIVDQLNGITLVVSEKERTQMNALIRDFSRQEEQLAQSGEQRLNGIQALCYSRIRKIDSDFQRTSRQHKVIEAMLSRMRESDTATLIGLMTNNWSSVKTDMTLAGVSALLPLMLNLSEVTIESMYVPLDNAYYDDVVKGMMVLVPNLTKNSQAIVAFLED